MPGYANRTVMVSFPEFTEAGDDPIHVIMRNPKMVPTAELLPPDLPVRDGESETERDYRAGCTVLARLVKAWHVYDASDEADDQAPLPLPATAELVAKLPLEIQTAMGEVIKAVRNPGN